MEHIERLNRHIEQGTLIRHSWVGEDEHGRATACLLAALVPQCGEMESSDGCPAEVMPSWLAQLTPSLDDNGSLAEWPGMVRRYAALAAKWHALDDAAWLRVKWGWLADVVREARSHTKGERVHVVCNRVIELAEQAVATGVVPITELREASASAYAAAASYSSAYASDAAASDAASAASASASDAASASAASAYASASAAYASYSSAYASDASYASAYAYAYDAAARKAAWDRMTVKLFERIERELP